METKVAELLGKFPCVGILGARQVGKTTLLKNLRPHTRFYDLEQRATYQQVKADPDFFLSSQTEPIVIDEAQRLPDLFPALRVKIDKDRSRYGQFLISGSSSFELLKNMTESLAGRVAMVELGGLSLEERPSQGLSPFYSLVQEKRWKDLLSLSARSSASGILDAFFYGSFPEVFLRRHEAGFTDDWMEQYLNVYLKRDIRDLYPGLNIETYQLFIQTLAASSGEILNASDFARALDVSQPTIKSYLRIFEGTFLWRTLPAYTRQAKKRVTQMPRGHLRDSGLLNHLLRIRSLEDLRSHPKVGRLWEAFITEEILKGFANRAIPCDAFYYRTYDRAEIDLILEGSFGLLPIEIKWGMSTDRRKLTALQQFVSDHECPLGLCINNAERIEWLSPKILQIPAPFL